VTAQSLQWDGSSWSQRRIPRPAGSIATLLAGVSCTAPIACTVGGAAVISSMIIWPLLQSWSSGRWSIDPAPDPAQANLYAVSCTGRTCMAVGSLIDPRGREVPLAESIVDAR
jgi:hypothetical protein